MPQGPVTAIVPLRSPGEGKTRLAEGGLSRNQRARLTAAMLADVIGALRGSRVQRIVVAAGGSEAAEAATALGVLVHRDPAWVGSLDEAVGAAATSVGPAASLLVVMADLPRLEADDIDAVLDADAEVVVAATGDGGTGALLRSPPDAIPTAYGPGSAERHAQLAERAGRQVIRLDLPGFRSDIDTFADLQALAGSDVRGETGRVLRELLGDGQPTA